MSKAQQIIQNRIIGTGAESPENLLANPMNWRLHPAEQRDALRGTLREVGWVQNVIVNQRTGHIVDGHLRVDLAMSEGEPEIPVVYVDLSEDEERIILAALDSVTGLATADQDMLDQLLDGIEVEDADLRAFLDGLGSDGGIDEEEPGLTGDDDVPAAPADPVCQPGDVWLLGDHRLICGDSLDPAVLEELMEGKEADMVWTDPPYNVDYEGSDGKKIQNDKMEDQAFRDFLRAAFTTALGATKAGGPIYIAHADSEGLNFRAAMLEAGWLLKQCLVWVKNSFTLGRQDYQWQHEPILYGWKPGAAHQWFGEFNKATVIDHDVDLKELEKSELVRMIQHLRTSANTTVMRHEKPKANADHPTMKPVDLIIHMLKNSSARGQLVLDIFGGSGSTLIACEKIGRAARLVELDPMYCDVIIRRYQDFTGRDAYRIADRRPYDEILAERDAA